MQPLNEIERRTDERLPREPGDGWLAVALFLMLIVVAAIPVGTAVYRGGTWGAEPSVGLLVVSLASWALVNELKVQWSKRRMRQRTSGHSTKEPCTAAAFAEDRGRFEDGC